jgi:hypothetical protein
MKCGTTSLHYYLGLHPEISMSTRKELDFFTEKKYQKGISWYESHFRKHTKIVGEASPNYTNSNKFPGVPERMYNIIPNAKLVYLVRDPIKRMISHYIHQYSEGYERRDINEALTSQGRNPYLDRSLYYKQISLFLEYFDQDNILVLSAEDLQKSTRKCLQKVFTFLEVDSQFDTWKFNYQRHRSSRKRIKTSTGEKLSKTKLMRSVQKIPGFLQWPIEEVIYFPFSKPIGQFKITDSTILQLKQLLNEDTSKFRQLTHQQFSSWSI